MNWLESYPKSQEPSLEQIEAFIHSPLWNGLCAWTEKTYGIAPKVEHSTCSGAPGWNVKYKKSGRALADDPRDGCEGAGGCEKTHPPARGPKGIAT